MLIINGSEEACWYDHSSVEDNTGNMPVVVVETLSLVMVEEIYVHMVVGKEVVTCKLIQAVEGT